MRRQRRYKKVLQKVLVSGILLFSCLILSSLFLFFKVPQTTLSAADLYEETKNFSQDVASFTLNDEGIFLKSNVTPRNFKEANSKLKTLQIAAKNLSEGKLTSKETNFLTHTVTLQDKVKEQLAHFSKKLSLQTKTNKLFETPVIQEASFKEGVPLKESTSARGFLLVTDEFEKHFPKEVDEWGELLRQAYSEGASQLALITKGKKMLQLYQKKLTTTNYHQARLALLAIVNKKVAEALLIELDQIKVGGHLSLDKQEALTPEESQKLDELENNASEESKVISESKPGNSTSQNSSSENSSVEKPTSTSPSSSKPEESTSLPSTETETPSSNTEESTSENSSESTNESSSASSNESSSESSTSTTNSSSEILSEDSGESTEATTFTIDRPLDTKESVEAEK